MSDIDDLGFQWHVLPAVKDPAEGTPDILPGEAVWVRLRGANGCHGVVSAVTGNGASLDNKEPSQADAEVTQKISVSGRGRHRNDVLVQISPGSEVNCGFDRLTRVLGAKSGEPCIGVVADTRSFRHHASAQVTPQDHVVEVGSSFGLCTTILHARAASCVGLDVSMQHLAESSRRFPEINFHFLDALEEPERLRTMPFAEPCTVCFVDIGGDRQLAHVVRAVELLRRRCLPNLRLMVVKSRELHAAMVAWLAAEKGVSECSLQSPSAFLVGPAMCEEQLCSAAAGSTLQQKKRLERCCAAAPNVEIPSPGTVSCGDLEAALPAGTRPRSGFHFMTEDGQDDVVTCLCLLEPYNPLFRSHSVVCVHSSRDFAESLLSTASHPVPVFQGRSRAPNAPFLFMGSFKAVSLLPLDDPLYYQDNMVAMQRALEGGKHRGKVHLLRMYREDSADEGYNMDDKVGLRLPRHPCEADCPAAWAAEVRRRISAIATAV